MKILAFGASASKNSINKEFATYTANHFNADEIEVLDLNNYPLPLYIIDVENELGIPEEVKLFDAKLKSADVIIISMAEHNGNFTAVFKNLLDWTSRYNLKMFENKKVVLVSTAPGARGGLSSLNLAIERLPRHGAEVIGSFSLPRYYENYSIELGIVNEEIKLEFQSFINEVKGKIKP